MSESSTTPHADTAGGMLRQARLAQGIHIAALAATIKVPQRKLESLEADRYDELPDPAFARALAQTMCRVLKINAEPVLAKLPQPQALKLDAASRGLGQPFNTPSAVPAPPEFDLPGLLGHPAVWGPALILLGALALWMLPEGMFQRRQPQLVQGGADRTTVSTSTPAASAPATVVASAAPTEATPAVAAAGQAASAAPATAPPAAEGASAPVGGGASAAPAAQVSVGGETVHASPDGVAATSATGDLQIRTTAPSWIGVIDAQGQTLLHRTVQPGESIDLSGATPLKVRVGNVVATQLSFRGQPVDMTASAKGNIARLELQ